MGIVDLHRRGLGFGVYILLSLLTAVVFVIDPLVNKPSGLIKLSWFTRQPLSHGLKTCSWDYEGSWGIGLAHGRPDPLHLNFSSKAVITCATLANATAVSFVADPFLFIPDDSSTPSAFLKSSASRKLSAAGAAAPASSVPWFAFYEMKNLHRYLGELGVAVSYDRGATWRHLGTAVSEPFHLSYPLVLYDTDSSQYLMFAETVGARDGLIRVYGTSKEDFPFGWHVVARKRPTDPGWPATRRWYQVGAPAKYVDTAPVRFEDRWWIFTTRVGTPAAGQPKYTLLLYTAETLLGEWTPHPANLAGSPYAPAAGGRIPYGIDADRRTARNGGRPFAKDGVLYRWAQDCSRYYGEALVLMRADVINETSYGESVAVRYEPTRDGESWRAERLHHADMQQLEDGSWVGLVDGDRYASGNAYFNEKELWFVQLKSQLPRLVMLQLVIVVTAVALLRFFSSYSPSASSAWGLPYSSLLPTNSCAKGSSCSSRKGGVLASLAAVVSLVATAVAVAVGVMVLAPGLVPCPR
ncbi:hypothetical protein Agub_g9491 [Astrephomene gubernaculifera]|uniref:Glucosamine inositolphosphorylceramide transferase 1 N-terminal domain-containing protein n=1 Tax=Astrephomene gubernaculifera TaxID=47775 RepID=A0AAD3DXR5_9CHLO|nr:hypothetical protein Agub_g9491 [Astrephomene gubernaculifera]